ncbi:MAG TPA: glycosyltransferase [Ktedonobacterales bacterium]|nr:glycosyltransferase [Ktedonobacterales bacterium]
MDTDALAKEISEIMGWNPAEVSTDPLFELLVESHRDERHTWRALIIQALKDYRGETRSAKLLDYGGAGTNSLMFAEHCQQVTYFALPGLTSEFAGKRFAYHHTPITQVCRTDQYQAEFDAVVSFDAPAHLAYPTAYLDEMTRITKPGGLLFLTADDCGELETLLQARGCRWLKTLEGGIHVFLKGPSVSVILRVLQASDLAGKGLESIRRAHPGYPVNWVLVCNGAPDSQMSALIETLHPSALQPAFGNGCSAHEAIVQTPHEALARAETDDVILLNSDIMVYDGWVRALVEAAYQAPNIGTALPLTNHTSLYALFPDITPENELNTFLNEEERELIDIPTSEGFCLFIKREALARVGFVDKGPGKSHEAEIDFCRSASTLGYRHVLTPRAFVFHTGEPSPPATNAGATASERPLLKTLAGDLAQRYITHQAARRPALAHVLHHGIFGKELDVLGGTGFHIRDLVDDLHLHYVFYIISSSHLNSPVRVTGYADGVRATVQWESDNYAGLLKALDPGLMHIHHTLYFPPAFVVALIRWRGPKVFTIHDYYALCPNHTLLNDHGAFCHVPEQRECARCARQLFQTGDETPQRQRALHQQLIDSVDAVLAPSQAALTIFRKGIRVPDYKTHVFPHPMLALKLRPTTQAVAPTHSGTTQLIVGFIGYNSAVKGNTLVDDIIKRCAHDPIRFVAIGNLANTFPPSAKVISTGIYERGDVLDLIKRHHLDVMVIASQGAETYSFTLSETWMAGVPAIVGPLGAPAERVANSGAGLVAPDYQVDSFVRILRNLAQDRALLARFRKAAASVSLLTDYAQYQELYTQFIRQPPHPTSVFIAAQGLTQTEQERLYRELEELRADATFLRNSRGVKMIRLARAARYVLATQGSLTALKYTLLWLGGKRGQHIRRLA